MARHKDANWNVSDQVKVWDECIVTVLMDIRDELKNINRRLDCHTTLQAALSAKVTADAVKRIDKRLGKKISLK